VRFLPFTPQGPTGGEVEGDRECEQLDAWQRRPVALGHTHEPQALIDPVRCAHLRQARADDTLLAAAAAVVQDTPQERRAHAAALRGRADGEHAELGLGRLGDLAEWAAVRHERHGAEHVPVCWLGGDQQLRL
jgi:hypothetical protein